MSRFDFGNLEAEPNGLADYYRVLADANRIVNSYAYSVPSGLQTPEYAEAILAYYNTPELASRRAEIRVGRVLLLREAVVPETVYVSVAALHAKHAKLVKGAMLAQLDAVRLAVEDEIEAGPESRLKVRVVPLSRIKPLPADMPAGMNLDTPMDIMQIETPEGVFVTGSDAFVIDRIGQRGLRGAEALRRQGILNEWAGMAVHGEAALAELEASRTYLLAQ
jgi:hypothetical protein